MRKLLFLPLFILILTAGACSKDEGEKPKYNKAETVALIEEYDANGGQLKPEQYTVLIKNARLLFDDIKGTMKGLLDIQDNQSFIDKYHELCANEEFMDKIAVRERLWRVLVLGQKGFSKDNMKEFGNLPDESTLIDYYDDCISARVNDIRNDGRKPKQS